MSADLMKLAQDELGRLAVETDPATFAGIEPALNRLMRTSGGRFHSESQAAYKALRFAAVNEESKVPECCKALAHAIGTEYGQLPKKAVPAKEIKSTK